MKIIRIQGGLGNQMFQYAFYKKMSSIYPKTYCDLRDYEKSKAHNGYELKKIFGIDVNEASYKQTKIYRTGSKLIKFFIKKNFIKKYDHEDSFFEPRIFENRETAYYSGYWQSEKFFLGLEKEIRDDFQFPKFQNKKNIEIETQIKNRESVSVHIRRGDYIGHPYLSGLAPVEYYMDAIKTIEKNIENPIYLIFSNDISWCKENIKIENRDIVFVDWNQGEESFCDMQLMSLCSHNIITNSSFSWWGAWLNKNPKKIVIAPEKWFTGESNLRYADTVPERWLKIKNS